MSQPQNIGRFWVIFEGRSQNLPWTKLFHLDLNKAVSSSRRKVGGQGTATQWGCRIKPKWLQEPIEAYGNAYEQVPCICGRYVCRSLRSCHWGICKISPKYLEEKSEFALKFQYPQKFHHPHPAFRPSHQATTRSLQSFEFNP